MLQAPECENSHSFINVTGAAKLAFSKESSRGKGVERPEEAEKRGAPVSSVPNNINSVESGFAAMLRNSLGTFKLSKGDLFCDIGVTNCPLPIVRKGLLVVEVPYPNGEYFPTQFVTPQRAFAPSHGPAQPSVFRLRAISDCEGVSITHDAIYAAAHQFPAFGFGMISSMMQRLNDQYLAHARLNHMPLLSQLAYLFWWLVSAEPWVEEPSASLQQNAPRKKQVPWKIPQQMLADFFGVPREEVNRKLTLLEKQGFLYKTKEGYVLFEAISGLFAKYGEITPPIELFSSFLSTPPTSS